MRNTLLLTTLALSISAGAQIFTSGLESWQGDTLPTDWFGVKTNIESDSIARVDVDPHGGAYAVRLINRENNTRRFTTQPMSVDSAQGYDITYWVRGEGEVRIAMFDGRTENNGYSPNTSYEMVNSASWSQFTTTVVCDHTNPAAEFIVYVRNTRLPENLVVDDVNIFLGAVVEPTEASIYEIQYTTAPDGISPLADQIVITGGIVTGVDTIGGDSYFIQAGSGPWSGIYVFDQAHPVAIGDSLQLQGTVQEYQGGTELTAITAFNVVGQYPVPTPQLLDVFQASLEQWEGVLGLLVDVSCTTLPDGFGEWGISQGSSPYLVDDLMYAYTPTVGTSYDVTGCIHQSNDAWKIEPRFPADIVLATSIEEGVLASSVVYPNPVNDVLTIDLGARADHADFVLMDALGRTVLSGNMAAVRSVIDVRAVAPGTYSLALRATGAQRTLVVQVR